MKLCILVGGAGYIGSKLCWQFLKKKYFDKIIITDIRDPINKIEDVEYLIQDIRDGLFIELPNNVNTRQSWVFNLAAVHREPGHEAHEYFDTNIKSAYSVNRFLEISGIQNLFFTSSIAPYGQKREVSDEYSQCYPQTPYGISKWQAEAIHQIWLNTQEGRRLVISRPSVIYGPGDPGNILRMIKSIKRGTFFIPGDPNIIKAHGYIYGFIDSVFFTMEKSDSFILYNYAENPCLSLGEIVKAVKIQFKKSPVNIRIPLPILISVARIISFFNPNSSIHPVRVKKAAFPTNIRPQYLIDNGFRFKYSFPESLKHWLKRAPQDFA